MSPSGGAASVSPAGAGGSAAGAQPVPVARHVRCGWIEAGNVDAEQTFIAHASWFDAIHPYWWTLGDDGTLVATARENLATVVAAARTAHVQLIPLVYFETVAGLRGVLTDPTRRDKHIADLVAIARTHNYDGFEIDYERLFESSDRQPFSAFMTRLGQALHAAGKKLTMALPALDLPDPGTNAYDYNLLSQVVDRLHIMGYDFHGTFSDHSGPIAPLGWIRGVVAHAAATGRAQVFSLGVANYGVAPGAGYHSSDVISRCPAYATTTTHMQVCPLGHYDAGRAPNCMLDGNLVFFEDAASMAQKITVAHTAGLGGVAYYALGGEVLGLWSTLAGIYP
jgi:spore germination protein YaaH